MIQNDSSWTEKFPTETGWYWFYGRAYGVLSSKDELELVRVSHENTGHLLYVARDLMHKGQDKHAAIGVWQAVIFPELPDPSISMERRKQKQIKDAIGG